MVIVVALVLMKHKQNKGKYSTRKQHAFGMTLYPLSTVTAINVNLSMDAAEIIKYKDHLFVVDRSVCCLQRL